MHSVHIITCAYCDFCGTAESRCASAGGTMTAQQSGDNMHSVHIITCAYCDFCGTAESRCIYEDWRNDYE